MQGLFRNPMADPGIIGVSAGGALGAVAAIALVKKPSAMAHLARERLQMVHPTTTLELELPSDEASN